PHPSFFYKHTTTPKTYTLSLHDALPISSAHTHPPGADRAAPDHADPTAHPASPPPQSGPKAGAAAGVHCRCAAGCACVPSAAAPDRKSTRLNSSHSQISYAVFCLKKKKL